MLKGIICLLLLCISACFVCLGTPSQSTQSKTVKDYYLRLPKKYFEANQEQRVNWMLNPKRGAIVDIKNGYLYAAGDGAQTDIYVRLFKRPDGAYLIAVKTHAGDTEALTYMDFYLHKDGQWMDQTKLVLPIKINDEFRYEMPRYGSTIKVTNKRGKRLYDLIWTKGVFELKRN